MNPYRFVSPRQSQPSNEDIAKAKTLTSINDILEASQSMGKFVFAPNEELTEKLRGCVAMEVTMETLPNGAPINRATLNTADGHSLPIRVYGTNNEAIPPRIYSADEVADLTFGFCTSDGQTITQTKARGGVVVNVPVIYVNLAVAE